MADKDTSKSYSDFRVNAVKTKEEPSNELHVYLTRVIHMEQDMVTLLQDIASLDEEDEIHIHINNYGGCLDTMVQLMNALRVTPCKVVTYLEAQACSAATFIFLLGDEKYIHRYSTLMLHYYSTVVWGKGQEVESDIKYTEKSVRRLMRDFYKDLLTKEELKDLFKGADFYLDAKQIKKRVPGVMEIEWVR